jgi:hypothetical protein
MRAVQGASTYCWHWTILVSNRGAVVTPWPSQHLLSSTLIDLVAMSCSARGCCCLATLGVFHGAALASPQQEHQQTSSSPFTHEQMAAYKAFFADYGQEGSQQVSGVCGHPAQYA